MNPDERAELVDMIAQAVIDRIEERERVTRLADLVVARVFALQEEEAAIEDQERGRLPTGSAK
jgi:hypothetical protein